MKKSVKIIEVKKILHKNPSFFLLLLVFLFVIPQALSYDHAWMHPEQFYIKKGILNTGPNINWEDLKHGLCWKLFEYEPRSTRPLSSFFEILDTKFRVWLWHYMLPHPSLSLTWIFSFILAPFYLYRLLKNGNISSQVALGMVSFYLVTPGVLSYEVMLFRPAKPMTNFCIIFCLYLASKLKKDFIDRKIPVPLKEFLKLWAFSALSFYWDETALLIFPALFFFFPQILKRKSCLLLWLSLPVITYFGYFKIIPYLSSLAGYGFPHMDNYGKFSSLYQIHNYSQSLEFLGINAKNLILETMGILVPDLLKAPAAVTACFFAALIGWGIIFYYILRAKPKWGLPLLFLAGLTLFFNYLIFISMKTWGPFYYGAFWSVFFVIYLGDLIQKANIPQYLLTCCLFFILINMFNCFLATNLMYKNCHYYPYNPQKIEIYFQGKELRFDPKDKTLFSGTELKSMIYNYWIQARQGKVIKDSALPKELCWLPLETEPLKPHTIHGVFRTNNDYYLKIR